MVASSWESILVTIKAPYDLTLLKSPFRKMVLTTKIPKIKQ